MVRDRDLRHRLLGLISQLCCLTSQLVQLLVKLGKYQYLPLKVVLKMK